MNQQLIVNWYQNFKYRNKTDNSSFRETKSLTNRSERKRNPIDDSDVFIGVITKILGDPTPHPTDH